MIEKIGHYQVLELLGEGGMGQVYRARDSRLGRDVAVKALPDLFQQDPERLARFEREARLLAALHHPHIASVFGLEEDEGRRYLVMELAVGEDLSARIARGPVPWRDAAAIALGIAQALEAAHESGIIHRDLKPANIKVTPEGAVKVLDFGLAKAMEGDPARPMSGQMTQSPTISGLMTGASVILGTAAYMSPEQARGYAVDRRADIWAFGVVLFEMLTGKMLHTGETISDTLASVLKTDPDWAALPADTPPALRALLRRCLDRDPKRRLRDIGEARLSLEAILAGDLGETREAAPSAGRRRHPVLDAAGALALLAAGAALGFIFHGKGEKSGSDIPHRRYTLAEGNEQGVPTLPAISPDGTRVAYVQGQKLWIRDLAQAEAREVAGAENAQHPFWSPDGSAVAYFSGARLQRADVAGGTPVSLCQLPEAPSGGSGGAWGGDGRIIFSLGTGNISSVSERGGDVTTVAAIDTTVEQDYHEPSLLPGGRGILAVSHRNDHTADTIVLLRDGTRRVILAVPDVRLYRPVYSATGHILYGRTTGNPGIWAMPFSLDKLAATGEPFLAEPEANWPEVAGDGTLVCERGGGSAMVRLVEADARGAVLRRIGPPTPFRYNLSLSGTRLLAEIAEENDSQLWLLDLARDTRTPLTFGKGLVRAASWSPDGRRFAYTANLSSFNKMAVCIQNVDGSGVADTLDHLSYGSTFTPDGRSVVYAKYDEQKEWELWMANAEGDPSPRLLIGGEGWQYAGVVSPDGRYIAYMSRESGTDEIFLKRFPDASGKWQVSSGGGAWPRWSADGRRIYYVSNRDVLEVDLEAGQMPVLSTPRTLFTRPAVDLYYMNNWPADFEVSGDGSRFYYFENAERGKVTPGILLVQNWAAGFSGNP